MGRFALGRDGGGVKVLLRGASCKSAGAKSCLVALTIERLLNPHYQFNMGLFLDLAAVLAPTDRVRDALRTLGCDAGCYSTQADRTLVLYQEPTGNFDRVRALSRELGTAAFACHLHDGDLWVYEFYLSGEQIDQFNTMPSYWGEVSSEEKDALRGDAELLARHWPGLTADSIRGYLRHQSAIEEESDDLSTKAYPDDEFPSVDCWQLADFLRKLGTPYPPDVTMFEGANGLER